MVYYSIYKILKDIIRTIMGNKFLKILFIFLLSLFVLFLFKNKSQASDKPIIIELPKSGTAQGTYNATLPSFLNDKYWFVSNYVNSSGNNVTIYYSDSSFDIDSNGMFTVNGTLTSIYSYPLVFAGDETEYTYDFTYGQVDSITGTYVFRSSNYSKNVFLWTNYEPRYQADFITFQNTYVPFKAPNISNPLSELESLNFDKLFVEPADFGTENPLFLHVLEIVNTVSNGDDTIYYYGDNIIMLDNTTSYYKQFLDSDYYYYSIPKYKLSLEPEKAYLLLLSSSNKYINNSIGLIAANYSDNYFDVIQINTGNLITSQDVINNNIQNIGDTLNDNTVTSDTETYIDDSLKFDNKNDGLNNLNNGFFSRLTSMLSNLLGYNLSDDTSVSIPLPNSDKHLILHSKDIYDNVTGLIRVIINAFWTFIFTFYLWKFINKIYIAVSTGNILDSFSSSGEAITNDML